MTPLVVFDSVNQTFVVFSVHGGNDTYNRVFMRTGLKLCQSKTEKDV